MHDSVERFPALIELQDDLRRAALARFEHLERPAGLIDRQPVRNQRREQLGIRIEASRRRLPSRGWTGGRCRSLTSLRRSACMFSAVSGSDGIPVITTRPAPRTTSIVCSTVPGFGRAVDREIDAALAGIGQNLLDRIDLRGIDDRIRAHQLGQFAARRTGSTHQTRPAPDARRAAIVKQADRTGTENRDCFAEPRSTMPSECSTTASGSNSVPVSWSNSARHRENVMRRQIHELTEKAGVRRSAEKASCSRSSCDVRCGKTRSDSSRPQAPELRDRPWTVR